MKYMIAIIFGFMLVACATSVSGSDCPVQMDAGDYCAFDSRRNAQADLRLAQKISAENNLKTLIVMGANWCHDSRALAGHFQKPHFERLITEHYRLVYIDVGQKDRNLDIARSFGLDGIKGTPTVIITDSDGSVLNLDTAPTWRNAASRSEDDIFAYFEEFATK